MQMLKDILTARCGNDVDAAEGEDANACAELCEGDAFAGEGADERADARNDARGSCVDQATTLVYEVHAPEERPVEQWPPNPHISRSSLKRWTTPWNSATGKARKERTHLNICDCVVNIAPSRVSLEDADLAAGQDPALRECKVKRQHCLRSWGEQIMGHQS